MPRRKMDSHPLDAGCPDTACWLCWLNSDGQTIRPGARFLWTVIDARGMHSEPPFCYCPACQTHARSLGTLAPVVLPADVDAALARMDGGVVPLPREPNGDDLLDSEGEEWKRGTE
jgi:hypothetical protein